MTGLTMTEDIRRLMNETPPLPTTKEGLAALQEVVDRAVRTSRDQYWCERLEDALKVTIPQMAAIDGHFYATDDMDCRRKKLGISGDKVFNANGYNGNGQDRDGFDRYGNPPNQENGKDGLMSNGFTRCYDKDGYDCEGITYDGYDRQGVRRKGRGPTPDEEAVDNSVVNPTTAVLGPDGKLYAQGTTEFPSPESPKPAKKATPKKVTIAKAVKMTAVPADNGDVTFHMLATNNA